MQKSMHKEEAPFRSELFSADQMERHGKILASEHEISGLYHEDTLLKRLDDNEEVLKRTLDLLTGAVKKGARVSPAGEWLLDNFYLIEEHIRATRRHFPKGYSSELPRLAGGEEPGLPRVYDLALAIISFGDGRLDLDCLGRFVENYQTVAPLKLGELWAIPIMLRLALIENLRRVAVSITNGLASRDLANDWADKMIEIAEKDPKSLVLVIADMARSNPPMVGAFVSELARRLQWQNPTLVMPLTWLEQRLSEDGLTTIQLIQIETQAQAANQLSISNSIGSLRLLDAVDWSQFVEKLSLTEQALGQDPAGIYKDMNFATRDRYRHVVERTAGMLKIPEAQLARLAVQLADEAAKEHGPLDRRSHCGYYLVGRGKKSLLERTGKGLPLWYVVQSAAAGSAVALYLGSIFTITAALTIFAWSYLQGHHLPPAANAAVLLLTALGASQLACEMTNWLAVTVKSPTSLPRMNFENGIPQSACTLVVVPTMLTGQDGVESLIEALEVRYLANQDSHIYFALLTDFTDADSETTSRDETLITLAREGIAALNHKYEDKNMGDTAPFFLFHRPRIYNATEGCWMGRERKRGKLGDLNNALRGHGLENFSVIEGATEIFSAIKYVITLDTDTQLPRDSGRHLIEAMEHPLNHPRLDAAKNIVVEGYGLLQPRVACGLGGARHSLYSLMHCREAGIDPYTRVVSDIYQDLFGEGSFIGKGIYHVDTFETCLRDRFPDNRILSHDLLEGCYVRSGLISDVQLFEDYPGTYIADVSRRHRWIRGDWQIASWLLPTVPGASGKKLSNPLSMLSRFKIFDNLRRSLVAPSLVALFFFGLAFFHPETIWLVLPLSVLFLPPAVQLLSQLLAKPRDLGLRRHLADTAKGAAAHFTQSLLSFACLPYEAAYSLDAVARTIYRLVIAHKNLLVWQAASSATTGEKCSTNLWIKMCAAPLSAAALMAFVFWREPTFLKALPVVITWLSAPLLATYLSRPLRPGQTELSADQLSFLNKLARKTWAYFDLLVVEGDNFLPPDNYQLQPVCVIAHRTSPTNMGMALLANLTALDFAFITAGQMLDRTDKTLRSMKALDRFRGHFYNWYDTQTLQPMMPHYISTVDSGNLAGHLLTLQMGLEDFAERPVVSPRLLGAIATTLSVLSDTLQSTGQSTGQSPGQASVQSSGQSPQSSAQASTFGAGLLTELEETLRKCRRQENTLSSIYDGLLQLDNCAAQCFESVKQKAPAGSENSGAPNESVFWAQSLSRQISAAVEEIAYLCPWLASEKRAEVISLAPELDRPRSIGDLCALAGREKEMPPQVRALIELARKRCQDRLAQVTDLQNRIAGLAQMDFRFLYDKTRRLLSIGYNVEERRLDNGYYDLLASEARLTTFLGIAQGQMPEEAWFTLGRLLLGSDESPVLCSWSGSMFEYLMPLLVMPTFEGTLLDQTYKSVVSKQIEYGILRDVPWGISESGYNAFDAHLNYQYRAFGVPGLGLKRGLADDLVIAPYASVMALMVEPHKAYYNLKALSSQSLIGNLGFYEAIDCTPRRLAARQLYAVVSSYMAHHQGMSLLSLAYLLLNKPMQKYFEKYPPFKATIPLLQERVPKSVIVQPHSDSQANLVTTFEGHDMPVRVLTTANTTSPEVQLLSNGRYNLMLTNSGAGYSRWKDLAVTRWRADTVLDNWGTFCYIKEVGQNKFHSAAYQPTLSKGENYEAIFSEARVEYRRRDGDVDSHYEIVVSPEDDIELRRVQLTNRSRTAKTLEITSYAEVVLTWATADNAHPAFSNLFVESEILPEHGAIICKRRPRSDADHEPWMFHLMMAHGGDVQASSFETDRARFIGRDRSPHNPIALEKSGPLSNTSGSVLDPIVSARTRLLVEGHRTATVNIVTGVAESREGCLALIERYKDKGLADRVFEIAWTHNQVVLRQINASETDAQLYSRLAGSIIYPNSSFRADAATLIKNRRGQSGLWGYAISGDLPIVLLQIKNSEHLELVRQLVQAHAYWKRKGLTVDLVIWNEDHGGYRQALQEQILGLIAGGVVANVMDQPGGIFVRAADQISPEDRILFQSVARVIVSDDRGSLEEQLLNRPLREARMPLFVPSKSDVGEDAAEPGQDQPDMNRPLILSNGLGGFTEDGREYVITLTGGATTPAPWCNVIANQYFGSVISETGASYTWAGNAHEYRLSPWHDDPVSDQSGEAYYIRDEESGSFWSPMPFPCFSGASSVSRHGFGYSVFEMQVKGIKSEAWVHTAIDAPVKFVSLKIKNNSGRARRLSLSGYVELVLGDMPDKTGMHVITRLDTKSNAIFARNAYSSEFAQRVAFFDCDENNRTICGDRAEFVGRNGRLSAPACMGRRKLSGRLGAGLDPCAAIQAYVDLAPGQERVVTFRLGSGRDDADAATLVHRFRGTAARDESFERLCQYWKHTLGTVHVDSPDPALNMLANGWLLYQTISCRLWARSGFYQSGGAFGFRDQLQDTMALVHAEPRLLREQIMLCATRQFAEGDVQHWWHPPGGRGVRTKCSDDYLWLPLATCRYVLATGDTGVLDESVHFLTGRLLNPGEESYYDMPGRSEEKATLYEHCQRAINNGLTMGSHGLPLMGFGDWNDGMNLVGEKGQGESVWLAFFLHTVLTQFQSIAAIKNDSAFANKCKKEAAALAKRIEASAWDGDWYRRAYFDDGTPLGSAQNEECQIDSIAQSWSVLSGVAPNERKYRAMQSLYERLVDRRDKLVKLLDPPFDKAQPNPGYIKGYLPGVRENGGQYTHSAIWATMAFAALGDSDRAWELFNMINPIHHSDSPERAAQYKVEPYVAAADVYSVAPHTGRGGWTWYTGSAGWMYRLIVESLLGLSLATDKLSVRPCLPGDWQEFTVHYRFRETVYHIVVKKGAADQHQTIYSLDGEESKNGSIQLVDDRRDHSAVVQLSFTPTKE